MTCKFLRVSEDMEWNDCTSGAHQPIFTIVKLYMTKLANWIFLVFFKINYCTIVSDGSSSSHKMKQKSMFVLCRDLGPVYMEIGCSFSRGTL